MHHAAQILTVTILLATATALLLLPQFASTHAQQAPGGASGSSAEPVPAYHAEAPTSELPETMEPSIYSDKVTFNAYVVAGRVKKILYQEPCYCHCDRSQGHGSLLDCFVGRHASVCDVCMKEAFY